MRSAPGGLVLTLYILSAIVLTIALVVMIKDLYLLPRSASLATLHRDYSNPYRISYFWDSGIPIDGGYYEWEFGISREDHANLRGRNCRRSQRPRRSSGSSSTPGTYCLIAAANLEDGKRASAYVSEDQPLLRLELSWGG